MHVFLFAIGMTVQQQHTVVYLISDANTFLKERKKKQQQQHYTSIFLMSQGGGGGEFQ